MTRLSRRAFLLGATAAGGLVALGGGRSWLRARTGARIRGEPSFRIPYDPMVFLRIDPDGIVTLWSKHLEMGQGIMTGLATIVADEMDADWDRFRVELAPGDRESFLNTYHGRQATLASTGIANSWLQMRRVGGGARAMLVGAAADRWDLPRAELDVREGVVHHGPSGRSATFGELAVDAMSQPVPDPEALSLKAPGEWNRIGRDAPRVDAEEKLTGTAIFASDLRRPGMLHVVVARPPRFGGRVTSVDDSAALQVPGVVEVVTIPSGVAVLAENTWAAIQGRDALRITWDDREAETRSTDAIFDEYRRLAADPGVVALDRGDARGGLAGSEDVVEYEFTFPYLAHAPMEPLSCVIERTEEGVDIWAGCQIPTIEQRAVAGVLGLDEAACHIHTVFAGASFGRRANPRTDRIPELAQVLLASTTDRPIQMIWTREDDLRGGCYRPMSLHRGRVGLDADGRIAGWEHRGVCASLVAGTPWSYPDAEAGLDWASVGGVVDHTYAAPHFHVDVHTPRTPVPVGFWRSVGDGHSIFMVETLMDELAALAGQDALEFRLAHVPDDSRRRRVLERVGAEAGWGGPLPEGVGRGVACSFDDAVGRRTYVAMVADARLADGGVKVERIVAAVDCGIVINPNIVASQIEGSVSFALSTAVRNEITLRDGRVEQSNFHDYEPTRITEMPDVEVHIVDSEEMPSGIGEAGVAPVAPAVANAVFALTGRPARSLPLRSP